MFKLTRYRLRCSDATLLNALRYDFKEYINALNNDKFTEVYWRKAVELKQQDFFAMYNKKIKDLLMAVNNEIRKTNSSGQLSSSAINARATALDSDNFEPINNFNQGFFINIEDMSDDFQDFAVELKIKDIVQAASLIFKNPRQDIQENDLFEIQENGKIIFLGFVTNNENQVGYGEFDNTSATLLNVGKMYSLARITIKRSFANYALDGRDLIFPNVPVLKDIFNNKNTFEIIEAIMKNYFYAKKEQIDRDSFKYIFDDADLQEIKSLNINFTMLYTLYLYYKIMNPKFIIAQVAQGQHKTYNILVNKSFQIFEPEFKTVSDILGEVVNGSMYDMFVDYAGTLVVRPPLYNYLGQITELSNVATDETGVVVSGRDDDDFIINNILRRNISENNTDLEIRTDAYFSWNFFGAIQNKYIPGFYEDLNALLKFGFRNAPPYANPNAMNWKTASILAAIMNHIINNGSRNINIETVADRNFQLGRLYFLQPLQQVGYLIKIEKKIEQGTYVRFVLTFTFLRNVEFLNVGAANQTLMTDIKADDWGGATQRSKDFLYDLYNIYTKFGLFGIFNRNTEITVGEFNTKKKAEIQKFKNEIIGPNGPKFNKIAAFKVMPSILDLIELIYSDPETKNAVKEKIETARTSDFPGKALNDGKNLIYFSFKSKLQAFFDTKIKGQGADQDYSFTNDKEGYLTSTETPFLVDPATNKDYLEVYLSEFNQKLKTAGKIKTRFDNYQRNMKFAVTTSANISINSVRFRTINTPFLYENLRDITQKLFNRIAEADAEMKEKDSVERKNTGSADYFPYAYDQFEDFNAIKNNTRNSWAELKGNLNKGSVLKWNGSTFSNKFFTIDFGVKYFPKGQLLYLPQYGARTVYDIIGDGNLSNSKDLILLSSIAFSPDWYFTSPAFNLNMETLVRSNRALVTLDERSRSQLKNQESQMDQIMEGILLTQHNEGRAIDIIIPIPGVGYVMMDYPGSYGLTTAGYTYIENVFSRYFNEFINIVNRRTTVKYTKNSTSFGVYNYHLGVDNTQYLNPSSEVFREAV